MRGSTLVADFGRTRLHASCFNIPTSVIPCITSTKQSLQGVVYLNGTTHTMTRIGWVCIHSYLCYVTPINTIQQRANMQFSTALGRWAWQWPTISSAILWPKRSQACCTPIVHCLGEVPLKPWEGPQRRVLKRSLGSVGLFSPWYLFSLLLFPRGMN